MLNFDIWKTHIARCINERLQYVVQEFQEKEWEQLDIGVFPWHSSIELSALFSDDSSDSDDIADWPNYNFSQIEEGKWSSIEPYCEQMNEYWQRDGGSSKQFFRAVSEVMHRDDIQNTITQFQLSSNFQITVFDPDDSGPRHHNYYVV